MTCYSFKKISVLPFIVVLFLAFTSCTNTKKAIYFDNISNTELEDTDIEPTIQKNDLLSIIVSSLNPEATIIFNTPSLPGTTAVASSASAPSSAGYLVDKDGNIVFPVLGIVRAAGLTQKQLKDTLSKELVEKKLLVDPIVNVRITNFRVTVLGEVARPTVVSVPNEKISLLEAIGMAGDMTLYAKRDNVLLIRVENGKKITRRIDLNSSDFLNSSYYYLKTNDVLYVEPNKTRIASSTRSQQMLPIIFSGLSFLIIILDRILR